MSLVSVLFLKEEAIVHSKLLKYSQKISPILSGLGKEKIKKLS